MFLKIIMHRHQKKWSGLNTQERDARRKSDPVWLRLEDNLGNVSAPKVMKALRSILDEEGQATVRPTQQQLHIAPSNPDAHVITDQQQQQQQDA